MWVYLTLLNYTLKKMGKIYITGYVYSTPIKTVFKNFYMKIIV